MNNDIMKLFCTTKPLVLSPRPVFARVRKTPQRPYWRSLQDGEKNSQEESSPAPSMIEKATEKIEIGIQNVLAVMLLGALGLSCANVLAKIGVITFALISVSVRYTIVGILLAVLVVYLL
jgi:hypothetical protein